MEDRDMTPVLNEKALYLGDNGRCFCGQHAGMSAKFTGKDISGQDVYRLTADDMKAHPSIKCETCR